MTVTLAKLREQIKNAKSQLIESAENWLSTEVTKLDPGLKLKWVTAIKSLDSASLQQSFQRSEIPLLRLDSLVDMQSTEPTSQGEPTLIDQLGVVRREYKVLDSLVLDENNAALIKLAHLTTIMEQLHQLDELLIPAPTLETLVPLDGLKLAHEMAVSINKEWRFVEPGFQTINYYTQRSQEVHAQLIMTQRACEASFNELTSPLKINAAQFAETLSFLANIISQAYNAELDNRNFVQFLGWRLRAHLPWHRALNQLSTSLFSPMGVTHPNQSLKIQDQSIKELITSVNDQIRKPYNEIEHQYNKSVISVTNELRKVMSKLNIMSQNLQIQLNLTSRNGDVRYLLSTQKLGLFSFFQSLHAIHGHQIALPAMHTEPEEESKAQTLH